MTEAHPGEYAHEQVYLKHKTYHLRTAQGQGPLRQTTRSWVVGGKAGWTPSKYAKKEYDVITKEEYDKLNWLYANRYSIGSMVSSTHDPDVLRKIAALIGYGESK